MEYSRDRVRKKRRRDAWGAKYCLSISEFLLDICKWWIIHYLTVGKKRTTIQYIIFFWYLDQHIHCRLRAWVNGTKGKYNFFLNSFGLAAGNNCLIVYRNCSVRINIRIDLESIATTFGCYAIRFFFSLPPYCSCCQFLCLAIRKALTAFSFNWILYYYR